MKIKNTKVISIALLATLALGSGAYIALSNGSDKGAPSASAGGSITVAYQNDIATLDPAIGYDWQNWSIIKSLFSRLLDYAPGTTDLIPDLATAMPKISADAPCR